MEYRDYYKVLGVPKTATQAEIKKAYRRLARQLHPDRNPGDKASEERFKEANEAHAVLSDPEKRKRYDELGSNWQAFEQAGAGAGAGGYGGFGADPFGGYQSAGPGGARFSYRRVSPDEMSGFSDFFRAFFGEGGFGAGTPGAGTRSDAGAYDQLFEFGNGGRAGPGPSRSAATALADARAETDVTLAEVARGAKRMVNIDGRRIEVSIPPGVRDGARIKLKGAGVRSAGSGSRAGDLYVTVHVTPDPRFERDGANLVTELPLTLAEALLGAEVPVATPTGSVKLRIRPNTQNGQEIHVAGKGLPRPGGNGSGDGADAGSRGGSRGDLVVRARVVLPHLDDTTREEMAELLARHPQPDPRRSERTH